MRFRLTGITTPFGGINWEYLDENKERFLEPSLASLKPRSKLKVFISSSCSEEKYKTVRKQLKDKIEQTQLADVYTFEQEEASTLSAETDFTFALAESDVCIFLIDNKDGIKSGVQEEIDIARKNNIMSLYYFCDENSQEKTAVELSIMGAQYAKSKTVHKFSELAEHGAQALINDIVKIFHYYCMGLIVPVKVESDIIEKTTVVGIENLSIPIIPKSVINNTDKCKEYILQFVLNAPYAFSNGKTNELDDWGALFLPTLFEGRPIKQFNISMYLAEVKKHQDPHYHRIVEARWGAIQSFFAGDINDCVQKIRETLQLAKELQQPDWVIKDILIDLRNHEFLQGQMTNTHKESDAQKELTESNEELYYPILDRINESLQEKYISDLLKERTKSPFSVSIGNDLGQYGDMLASSLIISLYNGSLTHIRRIYDKIKNFSFFLSTKYDDWVFRRNLMMMEIFNGEEKEVLNTLTAYPEIMNDMTSEDALYIIRFCDNQPMEHSRIISQLIALSVVGYYLDDHHFIVYRDYIIDQINKWLGTDNPIVVIGDHIFPCLEKISLRIPQNTLASICCSFIDKQYTRWYANMFKFIANSIDVNKMDEPTKRNFINHIIGLFDRDKERELIKYSPRFLHQLRKQDNGLTVELDSKVQEFIPGYYEETYRLETMNDPKTEIPLFLSKYVKRINKANVTQGLNGHYYGYASRDIATIRALLITYMDTYSPKLMNSVINAVTETLLYSKEGASIKLDAVSLLICIVLNYPDDYKRNIDKFNELFDQKDNINIEDVSILSSNIDQLALKIALDFLFSAMGYNICFDMMEKMSYLQNDLATTISVTRTIVEYFEASETAVFLSDIQQIVLQNALLWMHSRSVDIRWNTARIFLGLLRASENNSIINHQLIHLVDTESLYIKNLIMRNIMKCKNINETTREYVISKCKIDPCFVVRQVCEGEISGDNKV